MFENEKHNLWFFLTSYAAGHVALGILVGGTAVIWSLGIQFTLSAAIAFLSE